ncbi:MAG: nitrate reductase [Acidimicrobiia bacterium]|nr:nitrate reductase [Acidimicrobiia bacterium]
MKTYELLALSYRYPFPGRIDQLRAGLDDVPTGAVRRSLERFLEDLERLTPTEWEELHTRTVDLGPLFAPYVGWVMWGENYKRGEFMSNLKREQDAAGIDPEGELPDHLDPVLRYLSSATDPLADLTEVLPPALKRMSETLQAAEPTNPYLHLLRATRDAVGEPVGGGAG